MKEQFETRLEKHPDDWDTRLVYADWLDEEGDHVAANGQRWQAHNHKCNKWMPGLTQPCWMLAGMGIAPNYPTECINEHLISYITSQYGRKLDLSIGFSSRVKAEAALAEALHALSIVGEEG